MPDRHEESHPLKMIECVMIVPKPWTVEKDRFSLHRKKVCAGTKQFRDIRYKLSTSPCDKIHSVPQDWLTETHENNMMNGKV